MPYLKWISDKDIKQAVTQLLNYAESAKIAANKEFGKNVIDPFSAMFEIYGFKISYADWRENEETRQAQKTLQNHIGEFHQIILGSVKGWDNMHTGSVFDLANKEKKIIAEVKNKYNTLSGGQLAGLYYSLDSLVSFKHNTYKGYTAYYVVIIPKKKVRYDEPFTPSDKQKGAKCPINDKIREIDGASFYEIVTGDKNALENLFDVLPTVISDCSGGKYKINDKEKLKAFFTLAYA